MTDKDRDNRIRKRHIKVYRFVAGLLKHTAGPMLNFSCDGFDAESIEGPLLVIPNHSCAWDPVLVAMTFSKRQMYFVASEHILRWKFIGPLLNWIGQPIPRKKASTGAGTVMACLRHLKAGHSVVLFAEGEQTWNGESGHVFPATGKLLRQSGVTLVTVRFEGAYLALPRWASGIRKGKIHGRVVNVYTPEKLRSMTPGEINDAIDRDIYYDVWKWQDSQPGGRIPFRTVRKGRERAKGLEKALFMCPECGRIGGLSTSGDTISCTCGFRCRYGETGYLEGGPDFISTIRDWDEWQSSAFVRQLDALSADGNAEILRDEAAELSVVEDGHTDRPVDEGPLKVRFVNGKPVLSVGETEFGIEEIRLMALVLSNTLLFRTSDGYYQVRTENTNLRKYLQLWQHQTNKAQKE